MIYDDRLYIGLSSLGDEVDSSIVGELDALNATTGAVLWRFDTAMAQAAVLVCGDRSPWIRILMPSSLLPGIPTPIHLPLCIQILSSP